jgi:hypothetical protein
MKLHAVESAARKAKTLAQAAERTFKETAGKVKGVKEESRRATSKFKRAKKESKVAAKAAAHVAKAEAKVAKALKKIAARKDKKDKKAATPKKDKQKLSARAIVNLERDDKAPRRKAEAMQSPDSNEIDSQL